MNRLTFLLQFSGFLCLLSRRDLIGLLTTGFCLLLDVLLSIKYSVFSLYKMQYIFYIKYTVENTVASVCVSAFGGVITVYLGMRIINIALKSL